MRPCSPARYPNIPVTVVTSKLPASVTSGLVGVSCPVVDRVEGEEMSEEVRGMWEMEGERGRSEMEEERGRLEIAEERDRLEIEA